MNVSMVTWIVGACWLAFWIAWAALAMTFGGGKQRSFSPAASGCSLPLQPADAVSRQEVVTSKDELAGGFDRSVQHNPVRRCCYAVDN